MAAWAPSLRHAGHRSAEVDPNSAQTELFERLDSDSSGFPTPAEMKTRIAMCSNSKFKHRQREATPIKCRGQPGEGLTLPQFASSQLAAVFREYKNKAAVEEKDGFTLAGPHTPKAPPNPKSKMAPDSEAELQVSALASCSSPGLMTSPSRGYVRVLADYADLSGPTPVKSKMTIGRSSAKSDTDGQETHRNRDEVRAEIDDVLKGSVCLQQGDFDFKVRQHLHAILGSSGRAKLHEALVAVRDVSAKKKRTDVRNWPAYIVRILQSFHHDASAGVAGVKEVADDKGTKADELREAMAAIQRLKEELATSKEEQAKDAASPARRRASMAATLAPETDSEDGAGEDELRTFPAPPDGQSWEWPLSRHEKKVRVQLIERQIHAADRSALIREVKEVRRGSLASARNTCPSDDESPAINLGNLD